MKIFNKNTATNKKELKDDQTNSSNKFKVLNLKIDNRDVTNLMELKTAFSRTPYDTKKAVLEKIIELGKGFTTILEKEWFDIGAILLAEGMTSFEQREFGKDPKHSTLVSIASITQVNLIYKQTVN